MTATPTPPAEYLKPVRCPECGCSCMVRRPAKSKLKIKTLRMLALANHFQTLHGTIR